MTNRDYYEVLGVDKNTDMDAIKRAYRKLAMQYHPDQNPGDKSAEERFKEIAEAYAVLSDPDKKAQYDRYGHAGMRNMGFEGFSDVHDIFSHFSDIFDFGFGDLFGQKGQARSRSRQKGGDIEIKLVLTLAEIAEGVSKKIRIKKQTSCSTCNGSGAAEGSDRTTCSVCHGAGQVKQVSRSVFGQVINVTVCPNCSGEGEVIQKPCLKCKGDGVEAGEEVVTVQIPAGVVAGNYIPMRGKGHSGKRGTEPGDLFIVIDEKEDEVFERHEDNVLTNLMISFPQATLGDEVEVPTLSGKVKLTIPPGLQSGKILRLKGKGIPHLNSHGTGDQLVRVTIYTPVTLNKEEKRLLRELAKTANTAPSEKEQKNFFKKMREAFSN